MTHLAAEIQRSLEENAHLDRHPLGIVAHTIRAVAVALGCAGLFVMIGAFVVTRITVYPGYPTVLLSGMGVCVAGVALLGIASILTTRVIHDLLDEQVIEESYEHRCGGTAQ